MALFFYWFCCADIWDDCNKLEGVFEATRGQQFYRFKWIFPMWIACLLWLSSNRTTTSQRVTSLTNKKVHFIRTHQEDSEHGIQSPAWDSSWCAQRKKKKKHNEMHAAVWRAKPRQAVPRGLITNAASFFRHHKQTRICSKRESNSK